MKNYKTKICIILGTRPEIIKMAPIVRECQKKGLDYFILHTGQHYSQKMDEIFFKDLNLPGSKYNLKTGGQPYRKQVGIMVKNITAVLLKEKPDAVVVQGDTISVLAGALAANKLGIKLVHHEAGLRSHDTSMLEEVIRVIVDHISDLLMVPTEDALKNLQQEGKDLGKVFVTGNTIVDAVLQNAKIADKKTKILKKLKLKNRDYFLTTFHRAENVDKKERLEKILKGLELVFCKFNIPIIFPIHPRTKNKISEFKLALPKGVFETEPAGFLEFLQLEKNAKLILTDSGGIQEEAFILGVPCVTLRDNTERSETIKLKMNMLAGTNPKKILEATEKMIGRKIAKGDKKNPFGDGKAAEKIIRIILEEQKYE
ncbi:MAG: UDP-N-acetylglucosamine 2-epimerase (non-hydrolyzing) [Candidatus Staskawiczbacteria bacterium]|nr:UDP-N-acetylglucosamine 2-epimerase (non-hydrolyzing) [Candidatus Staskawiczbacteria bacterium]